MEAGTAWPGGQIFPPANHLRVSQGLGSLLSLPGDHWYPLRPLFAPENATTAVFGNCLLVTCVFLLFYAVAQQSGISQASEAGKR